MGLWVIVPVKPLRRGKSRLATILSEEERTQLNISMLVNTLNAINKAPEVETILVVSRDPAALALAREHGARTVREESRPELNLALQRATEVARLYAAQSVLILPADLPLIKTKDISDFIKLGGYPPEVIIAPDRRLEGTNAFLTTPVGIIPYSYGSGSFCRHLGYAETNNIRVVVCKNPVFGLDLDIPEDLEYYAQLEINNKLEIPHKGEFKNETSSIISSGRA
jgi:2-phospho-L-lactate guanylyltransferase